MVLKGSRPLEEDNVLDMIDNIREESKNDNIIFSFFENSGQLINYIRTIFQIKPNLANAQYIEKYYYYQNSHSHTAWKLS